MTADRIRHIFVFFFTLLLAALPGAVAARAQSAPLAVIIRGDQAGDVLAFVDPVAGKIVSKVNVGHMPAGIDVSADGKSIYVCIEGEKGQEEIGRAHV
mgnify:CR=1 FL=1